jgi:hypothetical protein
MRIKVLALGACLRENYVSEELSNPSDLRVTPRKTKLLVPLAGTFALAATIFALLSTAEATVLYQSPEDTSNLYGNNQIGFTPCCGAEPGGVITGAFGVGNTITFASSGSSYLGTVDLFGYAGGGAKPIEVELYSGTNPNTGTLLGSETVTPTGNGWTTESVNFGHLAVPHTLTFIVNIVGNNGSYDDSFVNWQQFTGVTGSPTTGISADMWYGAPGNFVVDNSYAVATGAETDTLAVQFNSAAPEPSTWAMMLLGFVGLGLAAHRRTKLKGGVAFSAA